MTTVQSWFSTNTVFGTPVDITLDELHVELFHPADDATAAAARPNLGGIRPNPRSVVWNRPDRGGSERQTAWRAYPRPDGE